MEPDYSNISDQYKYMLAKILSLIDDITLPNGIKARDIITEDNFHVYANLLTTPTAEIGNDDRPVVEVLKQALDKWNTLHRPPVQNSLQENV